MVVAVITRLRRIQPVRHERRDASVAAVVVRQQSFHLFLDVRGQIQTAGLHRIPGPPGLPLDVVLTVFQITRRDRYRWNGRVAAAASDSAWRFRRPPTTTSDSAQI